MPAKSKTIWIRNNFHPIWHFSPSNSNSRSIDELPVNFALLQLVGVALPEGEEDLTDPASDLVAENIGHYNAAKKCIEELAIFLKPLPQAGGNGKWKVFKSNLFKMLRTNNVNFHKLTNIFVKLLFYITICQLYVNEVDWYWNMFSCDRRELVI